MEVALHPPERLRRPPEILILTGAVTDPLLNSLTKNIRNQFRPRVVARWMEAHPSVAPEVLDEDLQIVRGSLASILEDVSYLSEHAGNALRETLRLIDNAHVEFVNSLNGS